MPNSHPIDTSPCRLMIVDDHPAVREGIAIRIAGVPDLELCGEAADVQTALRLYDDLLPDAVIVDLSLSDGHGLDLIKQISTRPKPARILVHSMYDEALYAERTLKAGAMGYINKKEAPARVIEAIRSILRGQVYLSPEMNQRILMRQVGQQPLGSDSPTDILSNRELEVFRLIGEGKTTGEIANLLHLSTHTIDTHRENIKTKLGLRNAGELSRRAVQWVIENG